MSGKLFTMRMTDEDFALMHAIARHKGLTSAALIRQLLVDERERLPHLYLGPRAHHIMLLEYISKEKNGAGPMLAMRWLMDIDDRVDDAMAMTAFNDLYRHELIKPAAKKGLFVITDKGRAELPATKRTKEN